MTMLDDVFNNMKIANQKAIAASNEYNELDAAITKTERDYCNKFPNIYTPIDVEIRIDDTKKKSRELEKAFKRYTFWKGEVERCSAYLQGCNAYRELVGTSRLLTDG